MQKRGTVTTVSVLIPSYNHAHFVSAAVSSALAQTYSDVDIIVIDDGSVDNTAEVVATFGDAVNYVYQKNQGLSAARNTGIRHARGDYIALLDADDLWSPEFIEESVKVIEQNPRVGLTYSWWSHIDENGDPMPEPGYFNQRGHLLKTFAVRNYFPPVSVLVRKSCVEEAGGFDEKLFALEDWDLWFRIAANGWEFDCVPQVLAQYRRHSNNMTLDVPRMERNQLGVLDKMSQSAVVSQIGHLIPMARANVHLNSALSYHSQGKLDESYQSFVTAVQLWPDMLVQEETWYRWVCADQPPGYQNTSEFKDLDKAAKRNNELLAKLSANPIVASEVQERRNQIEKISMMMLATHYYLENDMVGTRRQVLALSRKQPQVLLQSQAVGLLAKSFVGKQRVRSLRRLIASGN